MAILNCKECNGKISSSAKVCPHCGYPVEEKRKEAENNFKIILLIAVALIFFVLIKLGIISSPIK